MADPDFDKLRAERDANIQRITREMAAKYGWDADAIVAHVNYGGGTEDCYCACADGGPCEHEFDGWRDFEDGSGGETFCQRCGMGAMGHTMHTCWD